VLGYLEAHRQIEPSNGRGQRNGELGGGESIFRNAQTSVDGVGAVEPPNLVNPEALRGRKPCANAAPDIDHRGRPQQLEHDRQHRICTPFGAGCLGAVEVVVVRGHLLCGSQLERRHATYTRRVARGSLSER